MTELLSVLFEVVRIRAEKEEAESRRRRRRFYTKLRTNPKEREREREESKGKGKSKCLSRNENVRDGGGVTSFLTHSFTHSVLISALRHKVWSRFLFRHPCKKYIYIYNDGESRIEVVFVVMLEPGNRSESVDSAVLDDDRDLKQYLYSMRQQQRRATDFSQADNDLRRFLALREQNKRESDQDINNSYWLVLVLRYNIQYSTLRF